MSRKPLFWIVLVLFCIAGLVFTFSFFPQAFPLVNVKITMSRQQALAQADSLAHQHGWGPGDFRQAASFSSDTELQHFVELEAGGVEKFNELLDGALYSPYKWVVRHFKANDETETIIRFTPDGRFYGFTETLPESQAGASLPVDSALAIAHNGAAFWQVDLSPFTLVEKSQEKQIGGRTDHTFIYERSTEKLGEGFYRLRLTVAGDKLTTLQHFVKIPEGFERRYQEMRSTNETIAAVDLFIIAVLYGIIGIGVVLFFQLKKRWIKWRAALAWGCFIALLQVLDAINAWPLAWMYYDTALSYGSFFMRQILQLAGIFFGEAILLTLTFMAAEGLTREAFPNKIQLWKIWRTDAAASRPVLGYTVGGYLGVGLFFAFDVALYFVAVKLFGWWVPSSSLSEPDVLATYQPWLSSIAVSLHAGFWEECLFRAVPIAGAALLGRKFGRQKLWIVGAFVVQALIFGAGHANYPMQPAYARIVELLVPSIAFGLIYLTLGLLPGIILHFAYDVVWFALPLFVSSAPAIWVQQALVILFALVPLWIVFGARLKKKAWAETAPVELQNSAFVPPPVEEKPAEESTELVKTTANKNINVWLAAAGVAALALWIFVANFTNMAPRLNMSREEAEALAQEELTRRGIDLPAEWKRLSRVEEPRNVNDRFIWQEEGDSVYASLMGAYLGGPSWLVRFATFEGDVAARAEEYNAKIAGPEDISFTHRLPQKAAGDSLPEEAARFIAEKTLEKFQLSADQLKKVSVTPTKQDNRTDWEFVWADTAGHPLKTGECRLVVRLAGSEVVETYLTVYVPEEWSRAEREKTNLIRILDIAFGAIPFVLLAVAFVFAIIHWSRKQFDVAIFLKIGAVITAVTLLGLVNAWPPATAAFMTAAPWMHQVLLTIIFSVLGAFLIGAFLGMVNGFIKANYSVTGAPATIKPIAALSAGLVLTAALTAVQSLAPSLAPVWANYADLGARWPIVELAFGFVTSLFVTGTIYLLIFVVADAFSRSWSRRKTGTAILFVLLGFATTGVSESATIPFWLLGGLLRGLLMWLLFVLVFRHRLAMAALLALPPLVLYGIKGIVQAPYPGAPAGYALGIGVVVVVAFVWIKWLESRKK